MSQLIGDSRAMREVRAIAETAAQTDANVSIYGENGTGKELMARAIHYAGARSAGPLITLDCTAIPDGLMESQLFGHVRGAFTGAVDTQPGVFALADRGTLFLDEIGELSLPLQAKLLRALQFREFTPVGGRSRRVDVRFVTATNRDLRQAVASGTFRSDLYYRIGVINVVMPPLRERREDVPLLGGHFARKFALRYGRPTPTLASDALRLFETCPWPGNVRQLENAMEQAIIFAHGRTLHAEDFRTVLADSLPVRAPLLAGRRLGVPGEAPVPDPFFGKSLRELEKWYILETLKRFHGNRTRTARFVGLSLRSLQYKLKRYDALGESRSKVEES
jgi:transcriptional regulator with PAS, ATPase and Fis domain